MLRDRQYERLQLASFQATVAFSRLALTAVLLVAFADWFAMTPHARIEVALAVGAIGAAYLSQGLDFTSGVVEGRSRAVLSLIASVLAALSFSLGTAVVLFFIYGG